jgi:hypothetical protein
MVKCGVLFEVRTEFFKGRVIALMEAARTSETSVDIQLRTRQYIPEDSEQPPVPSARSTRRGVTGHGADGS